jgi:hypothetical protein
MEDLRMSDFGGSDFGGMGRNHVFQYWNDFATTLLARGQENGLYLLSAWQDLLLGRSGQSGQSDRMMDLWRQWVTSWMGVAAFPYQWWYTRAQTPPTLIFLLDPVAQASPRDQAAPSPIDLSGATLESTDLYAVGGEAAAGGSRVISRDSVKAVATDDGRRVSVSLVNLRDAFSQIPDPKTGIYLGAVHVREESVRRPVAMVALFVEPPR